MKNILFLLVAFLMAGLFTNNLAQNKTATDNSGGKNKIVMKRFVVERTFPKGLNIPINDVGKDICINVVSNNSEDMVTWVQSYVSADKKKTFCIYDAPSADAIRRAAKKNKLPVDKITEVSVLDPYFYK